MDIDAFHGLAVDEYCGFFIRFDGLEGGIAGLLIQFYGIRNT
jgi:hypothetical protein